MTQQTLPTVGGDSGTWGTILNDFLQVAHNQYGGLYTIKSISSSYNIGTTESGNIGGVNPPVANEYFLVNAAGGGVTVTLPDATNTNFSYMVYNIKKTDASANIVTIATTASQTIDGGSSATIKVPYVSVQLVSDSSNWYVI